MWKFLRKPVPPTETLMDFDCPIFLYPFSISVGVTHYMFLFFFFTQYFHLVSFPRRVLHIVFIIFIIGNEH